ncbi:MAG: membrane protein insertion efficiency factor YidD [Calditrichaeota bacterium]|nr:MAG: membrane protein insertion efficiency factor YidD [Calditrichota bacterium]
MVKIVRYISHVFAFSLIVFVRFYQMVISPLFPARCRYLPTCSEYMIDAVKIHGPLKGFWLGLKRFARCHPWGASGFDPVPPKNSDKIVK